MLDAFKLDGKTAIVTGAGRGLGAAIAVGLAQAGADVVISARTESELAEVAQQIQACGRRAVSVPLDLAADEPGRLVDAAVEAFGRVDIVVNNVGGAMPKPFLDTRVKDLERAFSFNVGTAHALSLATVPVMLANGGGSIINVTSSMGRLAGRAFLAYGTAKAALAHYTRLAAEDLAPKIRVNGIAPGSILTSALSYVADNDEMRTEIETNTPMRRIGSPDEIAATAVYLASPAAGYVTGKIIEVDGGLEAPNIALPIPDL
ncbi:SDR family oxidoreductase [Gordonia sp. HY002]|uniref:SDR family oxidoreductase n=1 Tax=Gordonia zhenghanii TaxID=2911516 RepID=UPI001EF01CC4|nr:SDR family oxidoreductase [Gordonia zhenghanii]MCF8569913.1 SDR family oxidoreductase [Gordonia zhenghanii]MCF8605516.1 SDR family oxidoreductase [Gordonia zhenghanii]